MVERFVSRSLPGEPRIKERVREHQLTPRGPDVELDHVDADLQRGVKCGERVGRGQRAGASPDPIR